MNRLYFFTFICFLMFNFGCTTAYKAPAEGPTAQLTLVAKNLRSIPVGNSFVTLNILNQTQRCKTFKLTPTIEVNRDRPSQTITIPANQKLYIRVTYKARYYFLLDYVSTDITMFVPAKGQQYFIQYEDDPAGTYFNPGEHRLTYYQKLANGSEVGFDIGEWDTCPK